MLQLADFQVRFFLKFPASRLFTSTPRIEWSFTSIACLVFRDASGELPAYGYPVPDTGCTAYRALFPADVECYDDDWAVIP